MLSIKEKPNVYRKIYELSNINLVPKEEYRDTLINNVLVRIFNEKSKRILVYIHGGGFVIGSINTHSNICKRLADELNYQVISIEYSLAPEKKFPYQINEIEGVCKHLLKQYKTISIMGDSAGANLAFASIRNIKKYIDNLIMVYPCTQTDYTSNTKFKSVIKNSGKSVLTKESLRDYMSLYLNKQKDYNNKLVNLLKNNWLFNYPKTIIITGTQDPLHDEGVELKNKLERFSVYVNHLDIENAKHGFLTSIIDQKYTDNTIEFLKKYL